MPKQNSVSLPKFAGSGCFKIRQEFQDVFPPKGALEEPKAIVFFSDQLHPSKFFFIKELMQILELERLVVSGDIQDTQTALILWPIDLFPCNQSRTLIIYPNFLQRQCLKYLLIWLTTATDNTRVHIKKVGGEEKTDLIKISIPSYESIVGHQDSILSILCIMGLKSSIFGLDVP